MPGVTWPSGFEASSSIVASEAAVLGRKALPLFTECWTPATVARGLSIAAVFVDFVLAKLALVLVVLALVVLAQARLQLLYLGGCHVKRRRPRRVPCPTVLALLAASSFFCAVGCRTSEEPTSSPPATQRFGVAARQSSDSAGAVPREPVPAPPNDTMTLDVPALARIHLGLPYFRRKRARDPRALESTFSEVCRSKRLLHPRKDLDDGLPPRPPGAEFRSRAR